MSDLESRLKQHLHRVLCPDPIELGDYQLGSLPAKQREAIEDHLAECPRCRKELRMLSGYLDALEPEIDYSLGERVKIWLAKLIPPPGPTQALAFAVRGDEPPTILRYQVGEEDSPAELASGELSLQVQPDPLHAGRKSILGLLMGVSGNEMRAALWQNGDVASEAAEGEAPGSEALVDEAGNFSLTNLLPGEYDLRIRGGDFVIEVNHLKV